MFSTLACYFFPNYGTTQTSWRYLRYDVLVAICCVVFTIFWKIQTCLTGKKWERVANNTPSLYFLTFYKLLARNLIHNSIKSSFFEFCLKSFKIMLLCCDTFRLSHSSEPVGGVDYVIDDITPSLFTSVNAPQTLKPIWNDFVVWNWGTAPLSMSLSLSMVLKYSLRLSLSLSLCGAETFKCCLSS